ncbi:amino acid ABC transporter permease [Bartonella sp. W8098]|uniref:amino acid ABC transporter permease n=1 Tax=Bartonella TaxID=773 RepID=UPI0018DD89EE|nr:MULTISPECIES: amino acid ABC transporter permease [Bartonella]MBH9987322.1 amino acid ABC transporter permease [Bartonella apis]MBI0171669.1 amino acid ABC transporter permease [Bartonella sp. W8151]MCT6886276.1 amino acid ABC transporter permease [Bartonella apis]
MLSHEYLGWIWNGYQVTIALTILSCIAASLLGAVLCSMRISPFWPFNIFSKAYIAIFRNTPLLVQLFFWYFGVSRFVPDSIRFWLLDAHQWVFGPVILNWPSYEFIYGFIGLALYTAAYIAEELRAGIKTVPINQQSAAYALGFTRSQAFRFIILPQAVRNALSPLLGQYMMALKNSSLTASIGVAELFYVASQIETRSLLAFPVYLILTVLYLITIALIEIIGRIIETRRLKSTGRRVQA